MEVSTLATINVRRNEYAPTFFPRTYSAQVSEHSPVGANITRVTASDSDLEVIGYFKSKTQVVDNTNFDDSNEHAKIDKANNKLPKPLQTPQKCELS